MTQTEEMWTRPDQTISTKEIDEAVTVLRAARENYEIAKKEAQARHDELDKQEAYLLSLLERAGKTKYHVDGLGTVNIVNRYSVKTPKELASKRELFGWIKNKFDVDTLDGMLSIHSATLNSFVNEVKEKNSLEDIPGLDAPTHEKIVRFTSAK